MDILKAVHDALKPVSDFNDILSGDNYVTSSSILSILQLCRNNALAVSENDNALAETKAELQAEIMSLEWQASAGPVAIRVEEGEAQPEPPRKKMTLESLLEKQADAVAGPVGTLEDRAGAEITAYCLEPVIQGDEDTLLWWKCAARHFPRCREWPKSTCESVPQAHPWKRVFSTAGKVLIHNVPC